MKLSHSQYLSFIDKLYGNFQFSKSGIKKLPKGQIEYHKKNFSKFFDINVNGFKNLNILETGAGPGVHASILAMMGANVFALDASKTNIKKIQNLKNLYKLENLNFRKFDLTKQYNVKEKYDLISCHNWVQHTPNPYSVILKLNKNLKNKGKFYISCYHGNTFRFFISQISRSILKKSDLNTALKKSIFRFTGNFEKYGDVDIICLENLFDDFFTPYCVTTTYKKLTQDMKSIGYSVLKKGKDTDQIELIDNQVLRCSFIKNLKSSNYKFNNFTKPFNEFEKSRIKIKNKCSYLAKKIILKFRNSDINTRLDICFSLYEIRALHHNEKNEQKYFHLYQYLESIYYGDNTNLLLKR